jgi:hypothetical protein
MKSGFYPEATVLMRAATFLQRLFISWNPWGVLKLVPFNE